ncbi:MAG: adenosine deaminase family protein [Candidatus Latescibacteria bacterium]|nr:adenosine deaminase family protein [Candidatus Latescibacterota bacterium]
MPEQVRDRKRTLLELHVHLEGSLSPGFLRTLAERYGQPGVPAACLTPDGSRYLPVAGFAQFLERYKAVVSLLRTPRDYHEAALGLGAALAGQGVIYAEVTVGYGVLHRQGVSVAPVQLALYEAAAQVAQERGVRMLWQADAVRQWGVDAAWKALEAALRCGPGLGVVAFGVGGDETALPAGDFAPLLAAAAREGFGTTLHAGETGGAESVREAVLAGAQRIGHATAAGAAPDVLELMAGAGVFAELCPGSNVATGAVACIQEHPLRAFLEAGVPCCLNTDDPGLFGLSLRGEYARAREVHGLSEVEERRMQQEALAACFAPIEIRADIGTKLVGDS